MSGGSKLCQGWLGPSHQPPTTPSPQSPVPNPQSPAHPCLVRGRSIAPYICIYAVYVPFYSEHIFTRPPEYSFVPSSVYVQSRSMCNYATANKKHKYTCPRVAFRFLARNWVTLWAGLLQKLHFFHRWFDMRTILRLGGYPEHLYR